MASWKLGVVVALVWALPACGLVLDTAPPKADAAVAADSGGTRDAMRRDTGQRDSGVSRPDSDVPPPPADSGSPGCVSDSDCRDDNPCTEDLCLPSGCQNTPADVACDDGIFCNGPDRCSAGACAIHDGDVCVAGTVCSEALGTCTGCVSDSDCPRELAGPWSACGGFGGICGEEGSRTRSLATFICDTGTCVRSDSSVSEACGRSTDGDLCIPANFTPWSTCISPSTNCATEGLRSRTRTEGLCTAGACDVASTEEMATCSLPSLGTPCTDGMCAIGTCTGPGVCTYRSSTCAVGEICCGVGGMCALPGYC